MIPLDMANPRTLETKPVLTSYWRISREPRTAFVAVLPLFVFYQLGILVSGGLGNGVDFVSGTLFAVVNRSMPLYLGIQALVFIGFVFAVRHMKKAGALKPTVVPFMLAESAVYALLFGTAVTTLVRSLGLGKLLFISGTAMAAGSPMSELNIIQKLVSSAGAGLYEELVFRVLLMGGLLWLMDKIKLHRVVAAIVAVVVSSVIFSAVHHVGAMGEAFTMSAFTYRVFAGVMFAVIYRIRGFAVAAYTHAFYDVWVMVF
jgi:membrane protease YdiL (CAAX protease family)